MSSNFVRMYGAMYHAMNTKPIRRNVGATVSSSPKVIPHDEFKVLFGRHEMLQYFFSSLFHGLV